MIDMPTESEPVKVIQGDCREVLLDMPRYSISAVITDPPYGIELDAHSPRVCTDGSQRLRVRQTAIAGDESLDVAESIIEWTGPHPLAVFASPYNQLAGKWRNVLVWDKGPAVGGGGDIATCWKRTFEMIYVRGNRSLNGPRDEGVLRFHLNTGSDFAYHPCQKPVKLLRYLIRKLTNPGDVILDPTAGSGSLGIAAIKEGRRAILIEQDRAYCAIARRRVAEAMGTGLLKGIQ